MDINPVRYLPNLNELSHNKCKPLDNYIYEIFHSLRYKINNKNQNKKFFNKLFEYLNLNKQLYDIDIKSIENSIDEKYLDMYYNNNYDSEEECIEVFGFDNFYKFIKIEEIVKTFENLYDEIYDVLDNILKLNYFKSKYFLDEGDKKVFKKQCHT